MTSSLTVPRDVEGSSPPTGDGGRFPYRPDLDGIRAIAVVSVIIAHISNERFGSGYLGVELFFVLSGYLITALLAIEFERCGRFELKKFYARRALRLLPALYACIAVWVLLGFVARPEQRSEHYLGVLAGATYSSNWIRALSEHTLGPTGYLWSLAVEEQFYLLWPVVLLGLFVVARRRIRRRDPVSGLSVDEGPDRLRLAVAVVVLVMVVLLVGWRMLLHARGASFARLSNGLDTRSDGLLLGAAMALFLGSRISVPPAVIRIGRWVSAALLMGLGVICLTPSSMPGWFLNASGISFSPFACALVVFPVVATAPSISPALLRALRCPPLVRIGKLSYGLYLWHPVAIFVFASRRLGLSGPARIVPTIDLLIGLTLLSERLIERPANRLKHRFQV